MSVGLSLGSQTTMPARPIGTSFSIADHDASQKGSITVTFISLCASNGIQPSRSKGFAPQTDY